MISPSPRPTFAPPHIVRENTPDGRILLRSTDPLAEHSASVVHEFRAHAQAHPGHLLVAEPVGEGGWARTSWGEMREAVDRLAQGMLDHDLAHRPVMILSGNSRLHLTVALAAMTLGVPVVPTGVAYSLQSSDHATLRAMAALIRPGLLVAEHAEFAPAVASITGASVAEDCTVLGDVPGGLVLDDLSPTATAAVDHRCAALTTDTVAKILFTSGSTGTPKGVINTHGMLAANQQQMRQVWPFITKEAPQLLDWLPWSHTFGGNSNTNLVLSHGGTLWIDDGRPTPALIGRTVSHLADARPTIYLNVPAGYAALLPHLERDDAVAHAFFERLRLGFFAAAALPQQLWDRLNALAERHGSSMQMTTSWGMTETSPGATSAHFPITRSDCLGVPLPGVELALVPSGAKHELCVRGPTVTPGYHRRPDITATAFDEDGYLHTGDGAAMIDEHDPDAGLAFRGRIAEDFKLSSGTFVSVGTLRPRLISASEGLITDAVLCGESTDTVAALVWLHPDHNHRCPNGVPDDGLRAELAATLERLAGEGGGASQRVERLLVLTEPAALDAGEITDKGYLNQRAVRERRAALVRGVSSDEPPTQVVAR